METDPLDEDSLSSMIQTCSLADDPDASFQAQLSEFPHTFQMQDQEQLSTSNVMRLKSGLESALEVGYKTTLETARGRNLLAYALWKLGSPEAALEQLEKVLAMEDQAHNLVTLTNKAVILWRQKQFRSATDQIKCLEMLKRNDVDFQYMVVKAKAELAFSYTRLGPSFSSYAEKLFQEVIPKAKEPELWLWKFGLGLTRRRALRADPHSASSTPFAEYVAKNEDLLKLFVEIKDNCSCFNLKAKAYSELANVLFNIVKTRLDKKQKEMFFKMAGVDSVEEACDEAYSLDNKDRSVLNKCGINLRRMGQHEKARERLEEALFRPSTRMHHHLGNIYVFLAECDEHSAPVTCQLQQTSVEGSESTASQGACSHVSGLTTAGGNKAEFPTLGQSEEAFSMQRTIKSPATMKRLTRDNNNVQKALEHYEKAIQISEGENIQAKYDLALLCRSLGELEEAKNILNGILKYPQNMFPSDQVKIYEQMGQISLQLAKIEKTEEQQKRLLQDGRSMLMIALQKASQIFSKSAKLKERSGEVFNVSFSILLKMVTESGKREKEILAKKSALFKMIRENRASLDFLYEMEQLDPKLSDDPKHLKLKIENYVELEKFLDAVTFINMLTCSCQHTATMQLFGDEQYVLKIYMEAARQALLEGSVNTATAHFSSAFHEFLSANPKEQSSSECDDSPSPQDAKDTWDVVIVHEDTDSVQKKVMELTHVLKNICGLKVPIMKRDVPPNKPELEGELHIIRNSSVVVVMAGDKVSRKMRVFIQHSAKRLTTVTLLVEGNHVPKVLKAHRSLDCYSSPWLFEGLGCAERGEQDKLTQSEVDSICTMLCFLFNVSMDTSQPRAQTTETAV